MRTWCWPSENSIVVPVRKRRLVLEYGLLITGLVLIAAGVAAWFIVPNVLQNYMRDMLVIKDGSDSVKSDKVLYDQCIADGGNRVSCNQGQKTNYFLFNLTNPSEVIAGALPVVAELGPYTIFEYCTKYNISFSADNSNVTFAEYCQYETDSPEALLQEVIVPNPTYIGLIKQLTADGVDGDVMIQAGLANGVMQKVKGALTGSMLTQIRSNAIATIMNAIRYGSMATYYNANQQGKFADVSMNKVYASASPDCTTCTNPEKMLKMKSVYSAWVDGTACLFQDPSTGAALGGSDLCSDPSNDANFNNYVSSSSVFPFLKCVDAGGSPCFGTDGAKIAAYFLSDDDTRTFALFNSMSQFTSSGFYKRMTSTSADVNTAIQAFDPSAPTYDDAMHNAISQWQLLVLGKEVRDTWMIGGACPTCGDRPADEFTTLTFKQDSLSALTKAQAQALTEYLFFNFKPEQSEEYYVDSTDTKAYAVPHADKYKTLNDTLALPAATRDANADYMKFVAEMNAKAPGVFVDSQYPDIIQAVYGYFEDWRLSPAVSQQLGLAWIAGGLPAIKGVDINLDTNTYTVSQAVAAQLMTPNQKASFTDSTGVASLFEMINSPTAANNASVQQQIGSTQASDLVAITSWLTGNVKVVAETSALQQFQGAASLLGVDQPATFADVAYAQFGYALVSKSQQQNSLFDGSSVVIVPEIANAAACNLPYCTAYDAAKFLAFSLADSKVILDTFGSAEAMDALKAIAKFTVTNGMYKQDNSNPCVAGTATYQDAHCDIIAGYISYLGETALSTLVAGYGLTRAEGAMLLTRQSVGTLLGFNGSYYSDPVVESFAPGQGKTNLDLATPPYSVAQADPLYAKGDRGYKSMSTGQDDIANLGKLRMFDGHVAYGTWDPDCTEYSGKNFSAPPANCAPENVTGQYEGLQYRANLMGYGASPLSVYGLFVKQAQREFRISYKSDLDLSVDGSKNVMTRLYEFTQENLAQAQFRMNCELAVGASTRGSDCDVPQGMVDLSRMNSGVPIFLSLPHFLWVDLPENEKAQGPQADENKHKVYMQIEPETGRTVLGRRRLQGGIKMQATGVHFAGVKTAYVPIFWGETEGTANKEQLNGLALLQSVPFYMKIALGVLAGVGSLMVIAFFLLRFSPSRGRIDPRKRASVFMGDASIVNYPHYRATGI